MDVKEIHKCVKCGLCLTTCPVYYEVCQESISPRGKIQLIAAYGEEDFPFSKNLRDIISKCLMCGTCTQNCPSGVVHDALFMRMRSEMVRDHGADWKKRVLFHFLSNENQLRLASKFAKFGRNTVLENLAQDAKLGNIPIKNLPKLNKTPFRKRIDSVMEPSGESRGTILYFTGCATNYVYDDIGLAAVRVLTRMGYRVEIPEEQVCCGLPMFFQGAFEAARENMLKNVALLDRPDAVAVVVDCATCGSALRREYAHVLEEMNIDATAAKRVSQKVKDISEFVWEHVDELEPLLDLAKETESVTYHAPCHLRNAQGVKTEVEQLFERLPGIDYVRAIDTDSCCGGGGTFFYDHPDVSKKIVDKKIKNAVATGARLWATGCPGCRVNLSGNLTETDPVQVIHPIQVVEKFIKE